MRFCAASDQAILVYLGEQIGLPAHERVWKLLRLLQKATTGVVAQRSTGLHILDGDV